MSRRALAAVLFVAALVAGYLTWTTTAARTANGSAAAPRVRSTRTSRSAGGSEAETEGGRESRRRAREGHSRGADLLPARARIRSRGASPALLTSEQLFESFFGVREDTARCIAERGGRAAFNAALRGPDGRTQPRSVEFDIAREGSMVPSSVRITPPIPAQFAECIGAPLLDVSFGDVGQDGVHVQVPLRAFRQRARVVDGGVPSERSSE